MSGFHEMVERDIDAVFFNLDEFAEKKMIDGKEMDIVIDEDELQRRKSNTSNPTDGVYNAQLLFYVKKSYFDSRPVPGQPMRVEKRIYRIADVQEDAVCYTITLERNAS